MYHDAEAFRGAIAEFPGELGVNPIGSVLLTNQLVGTRGPHRVISNDLTG